MVAWDNAVHTCRGEEPVQKIDRVHMQMDTFGLPGTMAQECVGGAWFNDFKNRTQSQKGCPRPRPVRRFQAPDKERSGVYQSPLVLPFNKRGQKEFPRPRPVRRFQAPDKERSGVYQSPLVLPFNKRGQKEFPRPRPVRRFQPPDKNRSGLCLYDLRTRQSLDPKTTHSCNGFGP